MGTHVSVVAPADRPEAVFLVRDLFDEWEAALSRFRPESELSRVNGAAGRLVHVSPLFEDVLRQSLAAAEATDGLFDPTLLVQLVDAGYDRTFEELPPDRAAPSTAAEPVPGGAWRGVELDEDRHLVRLPADIGLDFGGIAKGMAVDEAVGRAVRAGIGPIGVEAGGDLAVHGLPDGTARWPIAIELPAGARTVGLDHGALATSSIARRRWTVGGAERHHLIDPRTGLPVQNDLRSVSVAASTCRQAEVAAKAALVLGPVDGAAFLEDRGLTALLVLKDGSELAVGDWSWAFDEVPA